MNKNLLRLVAIIFAFAVAFAVGGCSDKNNGPDTQETTNSNNVVLLDSDSALPFTDYKIVRADKASKSVKETAAKLRDKIKELSGETVKLGSDFDGAADKEILVGNTKRLSDNTLLLGHFKIVREGNKIAILGGSDEAIAEGVNYFIENCMSDKGYLCGEGYLYAGGKTYSITRLEVGGTIFTEVYLKNEIDNDGLCEGIAASVAENIGLNAVISRDESKVNMVFTSDAESFALGDDEWGVAVKDGKLYIAASTNYTQMSAYNYVISLLEESKGVMKFTDGENKRGKLETKEEFYAKDQLVIYPELPAEIRRNFEYQVSVTQGDETHSIPVYDHTMEYLPGRGIGNDDHRRFSQFAFSGKQVRVDIKVGKDFGSYTVFPSAKQFKSEFKDGVISVFLDKPDYFGIRLDDDDNTILSVFADLPEYYLDVPMKDAENVIYVDGWMDGKDGFLDITEPETILYIAPGAVLNARVKVFNSAPRSKVIGRGVILDPFEDIYNYDIRVGGTEGDPRKLCVVAGADSVFDGPVLLDARCFNLSTGATGVTVRNYKALSSMMTTDGITANSVNSTYEHCWIYCGDNGLVISWTKDQTFRDITMGTTCAALYPQGSTDNILIEDFYVFRANDGILNHRYNNPYDKDVTTTITLKNIDCIDVTSVSRLFGGRNMGTLEKTITFTNVNLPTITGTNSVHTSNSTDDINRLIQMENPVYRFTENYVLNFTNLYIDGEAITDASQVKIVNEWRNVFTFENDGTYSPVKRNSHKVNYSAPSKVFVGDLQISFKNEVLKDGNDMLVPADEIIKAVRAKNEAPTVEKNGAKYIKSSDIATLDTVESAKIADGNLYITLKSPKGNLLLADEGKISQIAEAVCYTVELVTEGDDGDYIYYCYPHGSNVAIGGVTVAITDEIRMYGAGTYTVCFRAKASNASSFRYGWTEDNAVKLTNNYQTNTIGTSWEEYEFTIDVTEEMIQNNELIAIKINTTSSDKMDYFSFRYLELTKD